jgi:hypothetical protein
MTGHRKKDHDRVTTVRRPGTGVFLFLPRPGIGASHTGQGSCGMRSSKDDSPSQAASAPSASMASRMTR